MAHIGVNALHLTINNTDPLDDVVALNGNLVRQPGGIDLIWPQGEGVPVSDSDLDTLLLDHKRVDEMAWLLEACAERELQVILTFLTLGGGGTTYPRVDGSSTNAPSLPWDLKHLGRTEDGAQFNGDDATWDLTTLDPHSAYKRIYIGRIAQRMGQRLRSAEAKVRARRPHFLLGRVLAGIDVFNEIEYLALPTGSDGGIHTGEGADSWAATIDAAARGLRKGLGPRRHRIALFLPGLSSYATLDTGELRTFERQLVFVEQLTQGLLRHDPEAPQQWRGLDVHWYHRDPLVDQTVTIWRWASAEPMPSAATWPSEAWTLIASRLRRAERRRRPAATGTAGRPIAEWR